MQKYFTQLEEWVASSIAIGLGMIKKDKKIVILDGDGSLLMPWESCQ